MVKTLFRVITKNTYPQWAAVIYEGFDEAEAERVLEQSWSTRYMTKTPVRVPPASDMGGEVDDGGCLPTCAARRNPDAECVCNEVIDGAS